MWGVQSDFASPFAHSGWVQFLKRGEGCTNESLSSPAYPLSSSEVRFGIWAEPDSYYIICKMTKCYWRAEDGFNDCRVELFQQLRWQVELSQLLKEVQPLLGLFHNGLNVIVPLQVLGDGGAREPEWLHCSHSAVHDGEWGESRGLISWKFGRFNALSVMTSFSQVSSKHGAAEFEKSVFVRESRRS